MAAANESVNIDLPPAYTTLAEEHDLSAPNVVILNPDVDRKTEIPARLSFEDSITRIGFTQKVLAIKFLQILAMMLFLLFAELNNYWVHYSILHNMAIYATVSSLLFFGNLGLLFYCKEAREQSPYEYLFLMSTPLTFAFFACVVMPSEMLEGIFIMSIHLCIVLALLLFYTIFSIQTELKFTERGGRFSTLVVFVFSMLICTYLYLNINILFVLFPLIIASALCVYWLYDINAMVTNYYHSVITPSDYVLATLNLQLDYLFVFNRLKKHFVTQTESNLES